MKARLVIAFVLITCFAGAQNFEGTIKWSININITDPNLKAQMEEAEKKMKDPAAQADMKQMMEKMNSPEMKKLIESNPEMKEQMEMIKSMQSGGSIVPKAMTLKAKGGNVLSVIEGGPMTGMETLFLHDKNESYRINRQAKTYSMISKYESVTAGHDPSVTVKKTSESQKILNYNCTKTLVTVTDGTQIVNQVFWTTTELKGVDFKSLSNQSVGKGNGALYYKDLEGTPLKMEMTMLQGTMVMEVTEIKKGTLSSTDFQIPAGFTESKLPGQH